MQYLLLIYSKESDEPQPGTPEGNAHFEAYMGFNQEMDGRNIEHTGQALQPVATATTVRVRDGKAETTDGPFAETKEQLGGFYLVDCKDLDEAIDLAGKIPSAKFGSVEVRPIMTFD
jgi:hypothetical protein